MRKKKNKAVQYFVIKTSMGDGNINLCDLSRSSKQPKRKETHKASPRSGNGKSLSCVARSKTDARKPRKRRKGGQKTSIVVRSSVMNSRRAPPSPAVISSRDRDTFLRARSCAVQDGRKASLQTLILKHAARTFSDKKAREPREE